MSAERKALAERARFPRAATVLDAAAIAETLRKAATELDELAGCAHAYDPATFRRKVRAITVHTLYRVVELEGDE